MRRGSMPQDRAGACQRWAQEWAQVVPRGGVQQVRETADDSPI